MELTVFSFLKAHLCLLAGYILFKTVLASQPGFQINRMILLTIALVSITLPFWPAFGTSSQTALISVELPEFVLTVESTAANELSVISVLGWVYIFVSVMLLARTIWQIFRLLLLGKGTKSGKFRIVETDRVKPSSFFYRIFIHPSTEKNTRQLVLAHERVHAEQWHTLDTLLFEVLTAVFWINPAVWFLKRELRENHEYIADSATRKLFGHKAYLNALLNQTFQTHSVHFLPMFSHSQTLKNRIVMLTKSKSIARLRYVLFVPVLATVFYTAACSREAEKTEPPTEKTTIDQEAKRPELPVLKSGDVYSIVETMPEFPGGTEALFSYLGNNIKYPEQAMENEISGIVYISFVVEKDGSINEIEVQRGIGGGCDEEALRVIRNMPSWNPGMQDGTPLRVVFNLPIRFSLKS
jgi:TonB family protein